MTIPDVQTPAENSFDAAADLMIGKATKTYNSLSDARADAIPLLWQRIVSHADITLKGLQGLTENEVITTIVLTADADAKLVGDRWIDIQNGNILGPKPITDANILTINGTNLKVNKNNVEFWAAVMPATVKSLKIVVETNKATYTRNIESCNIEFKQNARKGLNVDMSSVERVEKEAPASWIATDLADITATDEVVITMANDKSVYALTSAKGSSAAPTAVAVTVKNKELTATPADNLVWNIANDNGNLTIYPKGQTTTWLYTTNDNNGVRVGKNENKTFVVDSKSGYLKNTTTSRYLGVYNNSDWRCYTSTSTNIGGQTLCFYVKGGPIDNTRPTLSVDQNSKVWAADATDAFVVKVTVNSEGGDWTVTPETLSWAKVAVDKAAGTITVTPNGANEKESANEATLTVAHASAASLTKEISLKQNGKGGAAGPTTVTKTMDSIVTENSYTISKGSDKGTKLKTLKIDDVIELSSTGGGDTGSFWGTSPDIDWRCYEATNSVVKISAKEGYIIEKFTLTFGTKNSGTLDGGKIKSGTEYNVNVQSVSYKIGHSSGSKNGQIRITAISVTYKQQ